MSVLGLAVKAVKKAAAKAPDLMPRAQREAALAARVQGSPFVDAAGKPLRFYHGTTKGGIKSFKGNTGAAAHVTTDPRFADGYTNRHWVDDTTDAATYEYMKSKGVEPSTYPVNVLAKNPFDVRREDHRALMPPQYRNKPNFFELENSTDAMLAAGFDSYYDFERAGGDPTGVAVFDPAHVKSIFNRGTFDPNDPDILKARGGHISTLAVKRKAKR